MHSTRHRTHSNRSSNPRIGHIYERYYNERRYTERREVNVLRINELTFRNVTLDHFEAQEPFLLGKGGNSLVHSYKHVVTG